MTIGDKIKHLRELHDMSQVDLANIINVSKQTLYKYENNLITNIPSDKIEAIARIFNISPAYLMGWTEEYTVTTHEYNDEYNEFTYNMLIKLLSESRDGKKNITIDSDTIEEMWRVENNNIFAVTECMGTIREKSTFAINILENFCDEFKIGGKFDYNSIECLEADDLHDLSNYLDKILDVISDIPYLDIHYDTPIDNHNITDAGYKFITKYNALNPHGKEVVDLILEKEYQNSKSKENNHRHIEHSNVIELNAAHEIPNSTAKDKEHDDAIMDDKNF